MELTKALRIRTKTTENLNDVLDLRKAKYLKRTGSPGNYKYIYKEGGERRKKLSEDKILSNLKTHGDFKKIDDLRIDLLTTSDKIMPILKKLEKEGKISFTGNEVKIRKTKEDMKQTQFDRQQKGKRQERVATGKRKSAMSELSSIGKNHGVNFSNEELLELYQNGVTTRDLKSAINLAEKVWEQTAGSIPTNKLLIFAESAAEDRIRMKVHDKQRTASKVAKDPVERKNIEEAARERFDKWKGAKEKRKTSQVGVERAFEAAAKRRLAGKTMQGHNKK